MNSKLTPPAARKFAASLFLPLALMLGALPAFAVSSVTNTIRNTTNATPSVLQAYFNQGGTVVFDFTNTSAATIQISNVFQITTDVTIENGTNSTTTITGGGVSPIFKVYPGVTLTVSNLTLSGGHSVGTNGVDGTPGNNDTYHNGGNGGNGGTGLSASGGAIYNLGTNIYINCVFLTNSATGGNGGNGGNGGDSFNQAGNGGNGGNGGTALGGAIYNVNTLILTNCTFWGNFAIGGTGGTGGGSGDTNNTGALGYTGAGGTGGEADGAAIYNVSGGSVSINACTFAYNSAAAGSSQSASSAPDSGGNGQNGPSGATAHGGAIFNASLNSITNCTFFYNTVSGGNGGNGGDGGTGPYTGTGGNGGNGLGGSIFNDSTGNISLMNCTLAEGQAFGGASGTNGSGPYSRGNGSSGTGFGANIANNNGTVLLQNSILAYPTNASNFYGSVVDGGYNISSDTTPAFTMSTSRHNLDPLLGPLQYNGGLTETLMPANNSPAINAIKNGAYYPPLDQQGTNRPAGQYPDIGSVEAPLYDISGYITFSSSNTNATNNLGVPNVTVTAVGVSFATAITDSNGYYVLTTLRSGNYNVTPQLDPFAFTPSNANLTLNGSVSDVDFIVTNAQFFNGEVPLGKGWNYLKFADGTPFGYYYLGFYPYVYHNDLGFEYFADANDGQGGAYFYDFTDMQWFYTSPTAWPYLYDFNPQVNAWLYYLPTSNPDYYSSNPRWFDNLNSNSWTNSL